MQDSKRDTDIKNRLLDSVGEGKGGMIWENSIETFIFRSYQIISVTQSCPTLCDPMNGSTPGLPVHHQLPEFTQTHVHRVSDAIQPSHPSGSSQCTSPEHSFSCIEPGLVICFTYDNIHVSMLFSQIIPPSPSPTQSKSLFFTSVSLLLSCI